MPTGYTAKLCEGDQSFEEFFLTTARAFCHIELRDEPLGPIPLTPYKVSDWDSNGLLKDEMELMRLQSLTESEIAEEAEAEYLESVAHYQEAETKAQIIRARLEGMLLKVKGWQPPTKDHVAFKDFMIEQLVSTIKNDGRNFFRMPERVSPQEWLNEKIRVTKRGIEYHEERIASERERVEANNAWITALVGSIGLEIEEPEEVST